MEGVQFYPEITSSQYEMTSGLKQALLSNPFYDYSEMEEIVLLKPLPFDLEEIQLVTLKK